METPRLHLITALVLGILIIVGVTLRHFPIPWPSPGGVEKADSRDRLPYEDASLPIEERMNDLLNRMTVDEKIGQLALVDHNSLDDREDITSYGLGALLSGGGSHPPENTPEGWLAMVKGYQAHAEATRLHIPLLYGVDANHGHGNIPGATIFPHNIGLGATGDADLVQRVASATTEEMLATGIAWNFAPSLDVTKDNRWGRVYETFGSNTRLVAELGAAYIKGTQTDAQNNLQALATAKHYIGSGDMEWGTSVNKDYGMDQGVTALDKATLRAVHLPPFKAAVDAGVLTVMAGLNTWDDQKVTGNHYLLTDVLKEELDFKGFVLSDWYGVYGVALSQYDSVVTAFNAGVDMMMLPFNYQSFVYYMHQALETGDVSVARLDDAVQRILYVKFALGLFDDRAWPDLSIVGSEEHRELAREAVRKSLVVLKESTALPIAKDTPKILVTGTAADNLGRQSGGWTVEWQGIDGNQIPGTTILSALRDQVSEETEIVFAWDGNVDTANGLADVGIATVGEKPYAEGVGDNPHPSLSDEDLEIIKKTGAASKKLIVIIISGRAIDLGSAEYQADAIIAAWLPGSEGAGVADVLFGDYPFTGILPVAWP
ncbi:MAG: glycoside hydrolase family 3 N-terminal domain-containing protein [Patescibacteria group bacterium]